MLNHYVLDISSLKNVIRFQIPKLGIHSDLANLPMKKMHFITFLFCKYLFPILMKLGMIKKLNPYKWIWLTNQIGSREESFMWNWNFLYFGVFKLLLLKHKKNWFSLKLLFRGKKQNRQHLSKSVVVGFGISQKIHIIYIIPMILV